jgi:hypothetical protein
VENKVNFQNRVVTEVGGGVQIMEEFKLQECDDDQIDLLAGANGLADLKNALQMSKDYS